MNLWLLIVLMIVSAIASFWGWYNSNEWTETRHPVRHLMWWAAGLLNLAVAIVCLIGSVSAIRQSLNIPIEDNSRMKAQCDSIDGKYAVGYCYKNGIQINWSTYGKE